MPARIARKMGNILLTKTMEKASLDLDSYDRLFPNQDTMPKGGFGNLIALPFQGESSKSGNTVFVDKYFKQYKKNEIKRDVGVLCATIEFGKKVVRAKIISELKTNTLVIVNRNNLLEQWEERLSYYLNINKLEDFIENMKARRK